MKSSKLIPLDETMSDTTQDDSSAVQDTNKFSEKLGTLLKVKIDFLNNPKQWPPGEIKPGRESRFVIRPVSGHCYALKRCG